MAKRPLYGLIGRGQVMVLGPRSCRRLIVRTSLSILILPREARRTVRRRGERELNPAGMVWFILLTGNVEYDQEGLYRNNTPLAARVRLYRVQSAGWRERDCHDGLPDFSCVLWRRCIRPGYRRQVGLPAVC